MAEPLEARLGRCYTGVVHDVMRGMGLRNFVLPHEIRAALPRAASWPGPSSPSAAMSTRQADRHATLFEWTGLLSKAQPGPRRGLPAQHPCGGAHGRALLRDPPAPRHPGLRRRRRLPRRRLHPRAGLPGLLPAHHTPGHRLLLAAGRLRRADRDRRRADHARRLSPGRPRRHLHPATRPCGRDRRGSRGRRPAPRARSARRSWAAWTRRKPI